MVHDGMIPTDGISHKGSTCPQGQEKVMTDNADKQKHIVTPTKYIPQTTMSSLVATAYRGGISALYRYTGRATNNAAPIK